LPVLASRDIIRMRSYGGVPMKTVINVMWKLRIWSDTRGQDLIEYALMAGFVAVAAGAIMPGVATSISKIFSKIASTMTAAASTS
jgi:pilus assembly protein Flp/PilA